MLFRSAKSHRKCSGAVSAPQTTALNACDLTSLIAETVRFQAANPAYPWPDPALSALPNARYELFPCMYDHSVFSMCKLLYPCNMPARDRSVSAAITSNFLGDDFFSGMKA